MQKHLLYLFLMLFFVGIMGCKKDDEILKPDTTPPDTDIPDDTTSKEIAEEARQEIFNKVNEFMTNLSWDNREAANEELQKYLKTFPEFAKVGYAVASDNVWARFTDGTMYILANNRPMHEFIPEPNEGELESLRSGSKTVSSGLRVGLPETDEVLLFNALGTSFTSSKNSRNVINRLFSGKGYNVKMVEGTIENLKSVKTAGVFYYSSHGGKVVNSKEDSVYAVWTLDSVTVANQKKYRDDIKKGNLVFMAAYHNIGRDGKDQAETHLAFTTGFVEKYMSFSQNAMMYLDICASYTDVDFYFAFLKKSSYTGTYVGWTDMVGDKDAFETARFFYDRLLANNSIYSEYMPETPKQRAFDLPMIFDNLEDKGLGISIPYKNQPGRKALLQYKENPNSTTLLRPSIAYMFVDEMKDGLYLWGSFGDDLGEGNRSITVDGVEVEQIESWTHEFIMCKIKPTGKGSAGDVIVKVKDHESHPRTLTEWRGVITYKRPSAGSMLEEVTVNVHIRRDVDKYRTAPGMTPVKIPIINYLGFTRDTKGSYKMSGTADATQTFDPCTLKQKATWSTIQGELSLFEPFDPDRESKEYFDGHVYFTNNGFQIKELRVNVLKESTKSVVENTYCPPDNGGNSTSEWSNQEMFEMLPMDASLNLQFDGSYNVKPGKYSESCYDKSGIGNFPDGTLTIEWSAMTAVFPPKSNAAL